MKLYPPRVEGIIPSFSHVEGEGAVITVPFSMNKAVSQTEVSGFKIKIKNVVSNAEIAEISSTSHSFTKGEAQFSLLASEATELKQGCFYKIQMAYVDTSVTPQTGYYSTVGVAKCTGKIKTEIVNLKSNQSNLHTYNYSGHFYHEDTSEKAYNYQFIVTNADGEILADSGQKVHNVSLDEQKNDSYDAYELDIELEDEEIYFIQYIVTTNNQLVSASPKYKIIQETLQEMQEPLTVKTELNFDNGYITVSVGLTDEKQKELSYKLIYPNGLTYKRNTFYTQDEKGNFILCSDAKFDRTKTYYQKTVPVYYTQGNYVITRSSSDTGYKQWTKVRTILINGRGPIYSVQKDFTIEQGKKYKYAIQEFNDSGVISKRRESAIIFADFEDMFISDGTRQLRIRFNPKVSSFQDKVQEAKTETIGYRYPIFFRNGQIQYKEFPITGLISYKMDEDENLFMTKSSLGFNYDYDYMERDADVKYQENYLRERKATIESIFNSEKELQKYTIQQRKALKEELKEIIGLLAEIESNIAKTHEQILDEWEFPTHNLTGQNIVAERKFKMEVLSWLNNGKPKVFRSPAEGNFIVRLMLVSMSPEDGLGRMLHSFSATADEIAEYDYNNLLYYNLIEQDDVTLNYRLWTTVLFAETNPALLEENDDSNFVYLDIDSTDEDFSIDPLPEVIYNEGELLPEGRIAYTLKVMDAMPGSVICIDGEDFQIGATGSYYMEKAEGIKSIYIYPGSNYFFGSVTYSYNGTSKTKLSLINSQTVKDKGCHQFIGSYENILQEIENIKIDVSLFYNLRFFNREIIKVKDFSREENYFADLYYKTIYLLISDYDKYKEFLYIQNAEEVDADSESESISAKDYPFKTEYSYTYILQDENGNDISKNVIFVNSYSDIDEDSYYKQTNCYVTPIIDEEPEAARMLIENSRPLYCYKQSFFSFGEKSIELPQEIEIYKDINVDKIYLKEEDFDMVKKSLLDKYNEQDFLKEFNSYVREKFNYKGPDYKFVASSIYINDKSQEVPLDKVIMSSYADILSYEIQLDDNIIDLAVEQHYDLLKGDYYFEKIRISNGNIAELSYKIKEITYDFEVNMEDEVLQNYKKALDECVSKINLSSSEFLLDADKLKEILESLRKEALINIKVSPSDNNIDFEENFDSYLEFLDLYKAYLAGEISISSIDTDEYPVLKEFVNKVNREQQNAIENYKKIYNLYISRVKYLFEKEKEDDYE